MAFGMKFKSVFNLFTKKKLEMLKLIFLSKILDDCANLGFFSHHLNHREVFKSVFYRDYQDNPQGHVWKKTG